jgi:hypothetical protein
VEKRLAGHWRRLALSIWGAGLLTKLSGARKKRAAAIATVLSWLPTSWCWMNLLQHWIPGQAKVDNLLKAFLIQKLSPHTWFGSGVRALWKDHSIERRHGSILTDPRQIFLTDLNWWN